MDKNYIKAVTIIEDTFTRISSIYDKVPITTFENIKGCKATEKLLEDLEDFIGTIKHYSKDTKEGYLVLNRNGRYSLGNTELTCGYPVEIFNTKSHTWNDGRIEHSDEYGGYYFYNHDEDHIQLNGNENMKVRIRK